MRTVEFNEFNRRMIQADVPAKLREFMLTIYSQQLEMTKMLDEQSSILLGFANTIEGFVELHGRTQEGLQALRHGGRPQGVEVKSEKIDD